MSFACDDYVFSLDAIEKRIGRSIPVQWPTEELLRAGTLKDAPRPRRIGRRPAAKPPAAENTARAGGSGRLYGRTKRKSAEKR